MPKKLGILRETNALWVKPRLLTKNLEPITFLRVLKQNDAKCQEFC